MEGGAEEMEQGDLETLLQSLPNDLAEFVNNDNRVFQLEKEKWHRDQEEKKKQEALDKLEEERRVSESAIDGNNELLVSLTLPQRALAGSCITHTTPSRLSTRSSTMSTRTPS